MRKLGNLLEGILDADFDITENDIGSLHDVGYKCVKFTGNKLFWHVVYNDKLSREPEIRMSTGFKRATFATQNSTDFDEIVDANKSAPFDYVLNSVFYILQRAGVGEESFKVGFDQIVSQTHRKYSYKFKYNRNNILFNAEWSNGAKVSLKFVQQ